MSINALSWKIQQVNNSNSTLQMPMWLINIKEKNEKKTENNVKINTLECGQKYAKKISYKYKGSIISEISECFNFCLLLRKTQ